VIQIIDPIDILKDKNLHNDLAQYNIDIKDPSYPIGWNYILDYLWLYKNIKNYLSSQDVENPIIFDVGCGNSKFYNILEENLNVKIIGIDRPRGFCHQKKTRNVKYFVDFLKFKDFPENSIDIIYWLSAIEHNEINQIKKLHKKSRYFLKKGGLLLMTFALSKKTCWFEPSQQTNLSIEDAKKVFHDKEVLGDYDKIHDEYRKNTLLLKDRYQRRYKHFNKSDPEFIVGGVKQIMRRNTILGL
jgi:SAM-dependent methyltransferase